MTRDEHDQLRGIVAVWLTNGNKPVDAGNDTRYDFFRSGWSEAIDATQELQNLDLVKYVGDVDTYEVVPTAKGIGEVLR